MLSCDFLYEYVEFAHICDFTILQSTFGRRPLFHSPILFLFRLEIAEMNKIIFIAFELCMSVSLVDQVCLRIQYFNWFVRDVSVFSLCIQMPLNEKVFHFDFKHSVCICTIPNLNSHRFFFYVLTFNHVYLLRCIFQTSSGWNWCNRYYKWIFILTSSSDSHLLTQLDPWEQTKLSAGNNNQFKLSFIMIYFQFTTSIESGSPVCNFEIVIVCVLFNI